MSSWPQPESYRTGTEYRWARKLRKPLDLHVRLQACRGMRR